MKIVFQEKWSYTLYLDGERYILSVVCGGVGMYELNIPLNNDELKLVGDQRDVAELAKKIRVDPKRYAERGVRL